MTYGEAQSFLMGFKAAMTSLAVEAGKDGTAEALTAVRHALAQKQDELSCQLSLLPSYDQQVCLSQIKSVSSLLDKKRAALLSANGFTFKSLPAYLKQLEHEEQPVTKNVDATVETIREPSDEAKCMFIQHERGLTIDIHVEQEDNLVLSNLEFCTLRITGAFKTLRAEHLKNCIIDVEAVQSAAFLTSIESSTLGLVCQQLRMHDSHRVSLYLYVNSNPIIEDCTSIGAAPIPTRQLDQDMLAATGLLDINLWSDLQDFKWLKRSPSPNWATIPVEERTHTFKGRSKVVH